MPCFVFLGTRAGVADEDSDFISDNALGYSLPGGCLNLNEVGWGGWLVKKIGLVLSLKHNVLGEGSVFIFTSLNEG